MIYFVVYENAAPGGLYVEAVRQDAAIILADLGRLVGARLGVGKVAYASWADAIAGLVAIPDCPVIVLDEFGYLCEASPELPSVIQRAIDASRQTGVGTNRLILCGSTVAQISHLLDRDQPLFGRAQLAQVIDAFVFRLSASYGGTADDPQLSVLLNAALGGLPGYRDVMTEGPVSLREFSEWMITRVLTPASPLLEEDTLVLDPHRSSARRQNADWYLGANRTTGICVGSADRAFDRGGLAYPGA